MSGTRTLADAWDAELVDMPLDVTDEQIVALKRLFFKSNATIAELRQLLAALEKKAAGRLLDGVTHDGFPG